MQALRRTFAFVYGCVLMYLVCVWFTGFMAVRQISPEYFRFFASYGALGKEAAHAALGVALHAIPTVLLLAAGVVLASFISTRDRRNIGITVICGAAFSYVFWLVLYAAQGASGSPTSALSLASSQYIQAPWWAWPAIAAPALGLALAYALLPKHHVGRAGA